MIKFQVKKKGSDQLSRTYSFPAPSYCTTDFKLKNHLQQLQEELQDHGISSEII